MLHIAVCFGGDRSCRVLPVTPVPSLSFPGWVWVLRSLSAQESAAPLSWRVLRCRAAEDSSLWLILFLALLTSRICASSAADGSNVPAVL